LEPRLNPGMLMSSVVIHDQVQIQTGWRVFIDVLQEANKFLMAMAGHAISDELTIEHAERGKQGRCAIADIVMRLASRNSRAQRQQWPSAIQRLNLTLFVHTKDQSFVRRIQIQSHNVVKLFDEMLVSNQA